MEVKLLFTFLAFSLAACAGQPARRLSSSQDEKVALTDHDGIETGVANGTTVVRADPRVTPLQLFNPPDTNEMVERFAWTKGLSVVINAAMFSQDYATSIGYMRNGATVNNPHIASKLQGFLLFNPKTGDLPGVRIGGKDEIDRYDSVVQTYRMWTEQDGILWKEGASVYMNVALVGVDKSQRVLFFYHPGLIDVHAMVAQILELGLDLDGLLYLDGGHHGALYLAHGLGASHNTFITLPNLLGITRR